MANWANISRNAKIHGDFAGRAQAEQDAYFEFFAGPEPSDRETIAPKILNVFTFVQKMHSARGLRRPPFEVASSESPSSN